MAVKVKNKNGKEVTLLNPSEKGSKYATELRNNVRYTNNGVVKADNRGYVTGLSDTQRAYRSGYLAAQKDSVNCYKAKQGKKGKAAKCGRNYPVVYK